MTAGGQQAHVAMPVERNQSQPIAMQSRQADAVQDRKPTDSLNDYHQPHSTVAQPNAVQGRQPSRVPMPVQCKQPIREVAILHEMLEVQGGEIILSPAQYSMPGSQNRGQLNTSQQLEWHMAQPVGEWQQQAGAIQDQPALDMQPVHMPEGHVTAVQSGHMQTGIQMPEVQGSETCLSPAQHGRTAGGVATTQSQHRMPSPVSQVQQPPGMHSKQPANGQHAAVQQAVKECERWDDTVQPHQRQQFLRQFSVAKRGEILAQIKQRKESR